MSEFKRQHPVASVTRVIDLIRGNLITILAVMIFGAGGGGPSFLWMFGGMLILLLIAGVAGWWRFHFRVEDGELQIHYGIFVRKRLFLTRDRIQVIDISSGLVQRLFGLVKVEIKTAGSTSREAFISAVERTEAEEFLHLLRPDPVSGETEGERHPEEPLQYSLPLKELLVAASTSGSFGIAFSLIATVFSQVEPLLDESRVYDWFLAVLPGEADGFFILSMLLVFVVFAWVVSFAGTLLRFGGFRLSAHSDELLIEQGVIEKKRITVPFNRIQAIRIVEGIFRQPFGYATVYVESAGYGEQKEAGSVVLMPLIRVDRIDSFLKQTLPEYSGQFPSLQPPRRALVRYIFRSTVLLAGITGGVQWLLNAGSWIWLSTLAGGFWGWLRYQDTAAGTDSSRMVIRSRILARTTGLVQKRRIQSLTIQASWFQRRRALATLRLSVASGDQGRVFQAGDLAEEEVLHLLPWLKKESPANPPSDRSVQGFREMLPSW
ncbi:MAG: PH domain-containing protein [Balneolaceae bacterium]